jgi:hypothetical protein
VLVVTRVNDESGLGVEGGTVMAGLGTIGLGAVASSLAFLLSWTGARRFPVATLADMGTTHPRTSFMKQAVEGEGHLLLLIRSGGQETGLVQQVHLEGVDFPLQLRGDLVVEVAET